MITVGRQNTLSITLLLEGPCIIILGAEDFIGRKLRRMNLRDGHMIHLVLYEPIMVGLRDCV